MHPMNDETVCENPRSRWDKAVAVVRRDGRRSTVGLNEMTERELKELALE